MSILLDVTIPVFLVLGFGYVAVWRGLFSDAGVEGLMKFTQGFAIPCLLFRAIWQLDLGQSFDWALLLSYYTGSLAVFVLGIFGARLIFNRPWEDSIAIGFCAMFANSVLLGLAITERAYGADALAPNYAIVALHAPFCYFVGLTTMEVVKAAGAGAKKAARAVVRSIYTNALMIGIALGFVANLTGLSLPGAVVDALDLMIRAALPAALFGLGGVLVRYRPEGDMKVVAMVCGLSLLVHPAIVWVMADHVTALDHGQRRSAILTASMAPGVNAYLFAQMYGVAKRVAATSVLVATAVSILSVSMWLALIG